MLKRLINWLFAKEDELPQEVRVFDFTTRGPGNDIAMGLHGDYAEAVVFQSIVDDPPSIGDFIVVSLTEGGEGETFVVDSVEDVSLGVSRVQLSRYEGAENA